MENILNKKVGLFGAKGYNQLIHKKCKEEAIQKQKGGLNFSQL